MNGIAPVEKTLGCSFCKFECDFGLSNELLWLPREATYGFCTSCENSCNTFMPLLKSMLSSPGFKARSSMTPAQLDNLNALPSHSPLSEAAIGPDPRKRQVIESPAI